MKKHIKRIIKVWIMAAVFLTLQSITSMAANMNISENGMLFLKRHEGCILYAYKADPSERYYTIGYGHYGADVSANMTITQGQAESMFRTDLQTRYVPLVNNFLSAHGLSVNQNQFDALVSLTYNSGTGWKYGTIGTYLKNGIGNYSAESIRMAFTSYAIRNQANQVLQGLINRRNDEATLFLTGFSSDGPTIPSTSMPYNPEGCLDSLEGGAGVVKISGWALDRNSLESSLEIHVYVGGPWNGNPVFGDSSTRANGYRPDVTNVLGGVGSRHGFHATIKVPVTGTYTVYVYAINVGGHVGTNYNTCLGSKTVTISNADTTPPVISNVKVTADTNGYTVTCNVNDASGIDRVMFPSWTKYNGQDDLIGNDGSWPYQGALRGTVSGNKATFRVNRKDHNNEIGEYITHIYAYDKYGNVSSARAGYTFQKSSASTGTVKPQQPATKPSVTEPSTAKPAVTKPVTQQPSAPVVIPAKPRVKAGMIVKDKASRGSYKVLADCKSVEYLKPTGKKASVKIPDTIKVNGVTCKVTSIAANAFKNNKYLTKITIGKNVSSIKKNAFGGCKKLKNIIIKTTRLTNKTVGNAAFKGIYAKATVSVPKKSLKSYKKILPSKGMGKKVRFKKI